MHTAVAEGSGDRARGTYPATDTHITRFDPWQIRNATARSTERDRDTRVFYSTVLSGNRAIIRHCHVDVAVGEQGRVSVANHT
jgi:hypothetical protein